MQTRPLVLTLPDIAGLQGLRTEVAAANAEAARLVLRLWVATAAFAVIYELCGGETIYPALGLIAATALLAVALPSGRSVEVSEWGLTRRGLLTTRLLPWSAVHKITWRRSCGVESLSVHGPRGGVVVMSSAGAGYAEVARRVRGIAAFRAIPISAASR
jgi:hypothetical protein